MVRQSRNKKVRNTQEVFGYGKKFKSKLELFCYGYFYQNGIRLEYEKKSFIVFKPRTLPDSVKVYLDRKRRGRKEHHIVLQKMKNGIEGTAYTPDFIYRDENNVFIIETKGKPNDRYPMVRKMFLSHISGLSEEDGRKWWFFEPHTMSEVRETYDIVKKVIEKKEIV